MIDSSPLTVIIISYNSADVLTRCLAPVIDSGAYPFVIVDNASADGSAALLQTRFPDAEVLALPRNIGYGRAANAGLNQVATPYALLINPDLTASQEAIDRLLRHAMNGPKDAALWGPASQRSDHADEEPRRVDWISGCAMLFDMKKFESTGFFDENIFLFFEETELCARTRKAGYQIRFCPDVFFDHMLGQASAPNPAIEAMKNWHFAWSRCYYFAKTVAQDARRSPERQYRQYRWKSMVSMNRRKRLKYRQQAAGARAFLRGEQAFLADGSPQQSPAR